MLTEAEERNTKVSRSNTKNYGDKTRKLPLALFATCAAQPGTRVHRQTEPQIFFVPFVSPF